MDKRILVTGSDGLVGSRFVEISKNRDYIHSPNQLEVDLTNLSAVHTLFRSQDFLAVINFAAFTDVDAAEEQRGDKNGDCYQVNVGGVKNLLEAVEPLSHKTQFIQLSTDMVFPGNSEMKGPYEEVDVPLLPPEKLTWYGFTKAEAEREVLQALGGQATILRINYPVRGKFGAKSDVFRKPLKLYDDGKLYPLFNDQFISISFVDEVVKTLDAIIDLKAGGVFHASSTDVSTPHQMIGYLIEKSRGVKGAVKASSLGEFLKDPANSPFRYPKYCGLSVKKTQATLGVHFSSWREVVDKLVVQGISTEFIA